MDIESIKSLNCLQKGVYYDQLLVPNSTGYNLGLICKCYTKLDIQRLNDAYLQALETANNSSKELLSYSKNDGFDSILESDFSTLKSDDVSEVVECFIRAALTEPTFIDSKPTLKTYLIRISSYESWLFVLAHHMVSDLMGLSNFVDRISNFYDKNNPTIKKGIAVPLSSFDATELDKKHYWERVFDQYPPQRLPSRKSDAINVDSDEPPECHVISKVISSSLVEKLKQRNMTLRHCLRAALILNYYFDIQEKDICFGNVVHGRNAGNYEQVLGMFSQILPAKLTLDNEISIEGFIEKINLLSRESYKYQDYSIIDHARDKGVIDETRRVLADIMFNYVPLLEGPEFGSVQSSLFVPVNTYERPPVLVRLYDYGVEKEGEFTCYGRSDCFDEQQHKFLTDRIYYILEQFAELNLDTKISSVNHLPKLELDWLSSVHSNSSYIDGVQQIHQVFERTADQKPDATAVIFGTEKYSYSVINTKANKLSKLLIQEKVGPEKVVGVFFDRSVDLIVSILAILKAGGAYLPLDINSPISRVQELVVEASAELVITDSFSVKNIEDLKHCKILDVTAPETAQRVSSFDGGNIPSSTIERTTANLAYVIFTSGSTGKPKGVMVEHKNLIHLHQNLSEHLWESTGCQQVWAFNAPAYFDSSVKGLLAMFGGVSLALLSDEDRRDPALLLTFLRKNNVNILDITPSYLSVFVEYLASENNPIDSLPSLIVGGDKFSESLINQLFSLPVTTFGKVFNVYGPTECTVDSTIYEIKKDSPSRIGLPLEGTSAFVLDNSQKLLSVGSVGELYIAGEGVSRGYINQPELTARYFLDIPEINSNESKLYKTGDLVCWDGHKQLEYIGRKDRQVKVRGYRVELAEIETAISTYKAIKEVVVLDVGDDLDKKLAAFVTFTNTYEGEGRSERVDSDDAGKLHTYLLSVLPEYMIPDDILKLDSMPLTPNGKVSRAGLLNVFSSIGEEPTVQSNAQMSELEAELTAIWGSLLNIENIQVDDNFFRIGGHSLLAVRLASRIKQKWAIRVSMRDLFRTKTIKKMAELIEKLMDTSTSSAADIASKNKPSQRRRMDTSKNNGDSLQEVEL